MRKDSDSYPTSAGLSSAVRRAAIQIVLIVLLLPVVQPSLLACDPKSFDYVACEIARQIKPVETEVNNLGNEVDKLADQVVPAMQTQLNNLTTAVNDVKTTFDTLQGGATDVVERFTDAIDSISAETLQMSDQMVSALSGANETMLLMVDEQSAGYREFVGGPGGCGPTCVGFRSEIARLIRNMEKTLNDTNRVLAAQLAAEGQDVQPHVPRLDFEQLALLIEQSPGALLFPLHEALKSLPASKTESFAVMTICGASPCSGDPACQALNAMNELLCKIDEAVNQLDAVTRTSAKMTSAYGKPRNVLCTGLFTVDGMADVITKIAAVSSLVIGLAEAIANKLEGWGLAVFDGGIEFGVSAAVAADVAWEQRLVRRKGKLMKMFIIPLKALTDVVSTRVSDCRNRLNEQLVICTLKYKTQQNSTYEECRLKVLYSSEEFGFY